MKPKNYIIKPTSFLSAAERKTLLKTCKEQAELDMLHGRRTWIIRYMLVDLALYSGLRVGEIAALKVADVNLATDNSYVHVRNGKGQKERIVYIDAQLSAHLLSFLEYKAKTLRQSIDASAPLFAGKKGSHSPIVTFQKSFYMAVAKAGLRQTLHIHCCRHTYATYLLQSTKNLRYVQKQLGHTDLAMTALYADILPEENNRLANTIREDDTD